MKNKSTSNHKSKSKSLLRSASAGLMDFLRQKYERGIPVPLVTAAHKMYGKGKTLTKDDKFIQRFSDRKGNLDTNKFVEYLGKEETMEKGKGLNEESLKRVYENSSNQDGKLTFEYIMKMGERSGITITQQMAKGMVRKYGKRKDHLNL